ncbi:hypothetical protein AAHA92_02806 [Salvia divinorum]|uniref:Uncharacterized protein n=1 Tax=Salvia divinorum TaxID=28513 RepID=A0ABD1IF28_SALDI
MSSACTLVGCGMRNITSCLFARRLRFEEKPDSISPENSSGSIVFDFTSGGIRRPAKRNPENRGKSVQTSPSHFNAINGSEDEEDYLVFLFREDGAIDIINDGDDEDAEAGEDENVTAARSYCNGLIFTDEENESNDYEMKETKKDELEDCDSNISDTSSASFAFPILKIEEWMGSPVHMPKQENQGVRLHCCRF